MKPILFEKDATDFSTLGICRLPDAESCLVTEERNGAYELELTYPVSGRHFDEIEIDRIIAAVPHDGGEKQAFRIYATDTTIDGRVVFYARHISYQMNFIPITPVSGTAAGAQALLNALAAAAQITCPFTFESDITGAKTYAVDAPVSLRSAIGGEENSALNLYQGELEWDNWTVKLHAARGTDNGVRITYGKNLSDMRQNIDVGETITGVMAYWQKKDNDGNVETVYSSPSVVSISNEYAHERIIPLDVSMEFKEKPSAADVTAYATEWLASTTQTDPTAEMEISFVPLWQTDEFKAFAPLERVGLCDTVYVSYKQLGVTAKKKVTKTVYNVLLDRYDSIELGSAETIADTIEGIGSLGAGTAALVEKIPILEHIDDASAANYTLTSGGYYNLTPSNIPAGKTIVAISIITWQSASGAFAVYPYGNRGAYLIGDGGTTINGLKLRYWYV